MIPVITRMSQGDDIAVKIEQGPNDQEYYYGRHFNHEDKLISRISRDSIDLLKKHFRDEMTASDWNLVTTHYSLTIHSLFAD